jgi:uncharacterized protein
MRLRSARPNRIVAAASAILILSLIVASYSLAAEPKYPALSGRVVDDAGVLNSSTVSELTRMLADHERATGQQVVVVTLESLQGIAIEDYGYQLGRHWGIGQKGANTGVLLIVAPKEHKVRIEVGYGLEGTLTDAASSTIIQNYILPAFKRGDFNGGVLAGTQAIVQVLGGSPLGAEPASPPVANRAPVPWGFLAAWFLLFFGPWIIFLINWFRHRGDPAWWAQHRGAFVLHRVNGGGYGGSSSWGGGGGGGDGGFSGGGGSFGGGGASGSW